MTITKSGELASFYTVNKTPIKHLRVYFSPKQAGSGDPSPENVREISGWEGINIFNENTRHNIIIKNIENIQFIVGTADVSLTEKNRLYISNVTDAVGFELEIEPILFNKNMEGCIFFLSSDTPVSYNERNFIIQFRNAQSENVTALFYNTSPYFNDGIVKISNISNDFSDIATKIRIVTNKSISISPFYIQENNIYKETYNWSSSLGTIYGGYVDLVTGEVCDEWYNVDPSQWIKYKESNGYYAYILRNTPSAENYSPTAGIQKISNMISEYGSFNSSNMNKNIIQYPNYVGLQQDIDIMNLQYMYKLAEPITYQLSPTQLSAFLGRNNIWSNADRVEIEYDLAESNDILYRRRNVLEKQYPHIITPAANGLINFNTDIKAPLKQCKVYFNPIQEGEGDPSPENVRPITGWTKVNISQTAKNIIHLDGNFYRFYPSNGSFISSGTAYSTIIFPIPKAIIYYESPENGACNYTGLCDEIPGLNVPVYNVLTMTNRRKTTFDNSDGHKFMFLTLNRANETNITSFLDKQLIISLNQYEDTYSFPSGIITAINWSNSAGTVYGGYVDLVKGELIQTCYNMIVDENTIINKSEDKHGVYRIVYNLPYTGADKNALMCNKFGLRIRNSAMYNYPTKGLIALGDYNTITTNLQIGAPDEEITTQEKWLNWLTVNGPIQVIYELAEPIHYSLTSTQLKTLRGTNNIWSSANDKIEIKYWKH